MIHIRYSNMPQFCQNPMKGVYEYDQHIPFYMAWKKTKPI